MSKYIKPLPTRETPKPKPWLLRNPKPGESHITPGKRDPIDIHAVAMRYIDHQKAQGKEVSTIHLTRAQAFRSIGMASMETDMKERGIDVVLVEGLDEVVYDELHAADIDRNFKKFTS